MYITISGKKTLPKIPTRKPENFQPISKEALRSMSKSANIYITRINQELNYSESLAKTMPKIRKLTK